MANEDWTPGRGGLLPLSWPQGNHKGRYYQLTTAAAAAVFIGQPMDLDANGRVLPAVVGDNAEILGPALGFLSTTLDAPPSSQFDLTQGPELPQNTDAQVFVCDDPNQEFVIQADTGGGTVAAADIGTNATFAFRTTSGSTVTGYSTAELDTSDIAADTGGALRIIGLHRVINPDGTDNAFAENFTKLVVRIYHHRLTHQAGAI